MEKYLNKNTTDEEVIKCARLLYSIICYRDYQGFDREQTMDIGLLSLANGVLRPVIKLKRKI